MSQAVHSTPAIFRFGDYEADVSAGAVTKNGHHIPLREQSFVVLAALLEEAGEVVTREELRTRLWHGDIHVDYENNLNAIVARLRQALCDTADQPRYIETLPKHGYRFIAPVTFARRACDDQRRSRARLIVLPFLNLTGSAAEEYFSDAMTDEIITAFAKLNPDRLAVIARTTAMHYKRNGKDIAAIGRDLNVDYVVEGGVRRQDSVVATNVQLIECADQTHLFAERYLSPVAEVFSLHERIVRDVAGYIPLLADDVGFSRRHLRSPRRGNLDACREYMTGRACFDRGSPESYAAARAHFEASVNFDPQYADAFDGLAELDWYLGYFGFMPPRKAFSSGIVHALRALEIDDERAETHALLGQFHKTAEYNWGEVDREMAIAIRLSPNSPIVRTRYAVSALMPRGNVAEAANELRRALDVDPLSITARNWLGVMLTLGRRYDECFQNAAQLLELQPSSWAAYFTRGLCKHYTRDRSGAVADMSHAATLSGLAPGPLGWLGLLLASTGDRAGARAILEELEERARERYVPPSCFAWIHLGLGDLDNGFNCMDRAVDECDQFMMPIKNYGFLDPLRGDARYLALLRKMNLESQK